MVPDTSVLVDAAVSKKISKGDIAPEEIIIHEAVIAELEHMANENKAIGFLGLDEIGRIKELSEEKGFKIRFGGRRPTLREVRESSLGEIDALIRDLAFDESATLITADKVQAKVAKTKGIPVLFIEQSQTKKKLELDKYFDKTTMSVHLRENVPPYAKKGVPGSWQFVKVKDDLLKQEEIQDISREIIEEAGHRRDGFIEIERPGSTIAQLGSYRITITRPPFSDGWEITAVRPVKRMGLSDYKLSEKLQARISEQAEGVLIAGSPGHGKSTFAQALAEFYASKGRIVKTIEAPRDLVLPETITQYAISHGTQEEIHDILLLCRPDYTLFDEMRNTNDFRLFADLRLSGIGLAGVVHATNPIDAIQRFVGRIELGVIPQVIDTVIFIKNGAVDKVLALKMMVKVPSGMTEADLARPVVVVNDFETDRLEFELYSYGEETVVVPVGKDEGASSPAKTLASKTIADELHKHVEHVEVEMVSDHKCIVRVPEHRIAKIIGRGGENITQLERKLGIRIDVQPLEEEKGGQTVQPVETNVSKKFILFNLGGKYSNRDVHIFIDNDFVLTAKAGKTGLIRIKRNNKMGQVLTEAINTKERLEFRL
ncbi:MAG: PINc/VapC family ATPase [Nanoarchaeota archaeon]|nr:PINc/VapC family ATPase [Nanoarchaeota archaeon]